VAYVNMFGVTEENHEDSQSGHRSPGSSEYETELQTRNQLLRFTLTL